MNVGKYASINSSLFVIGLYSNITLLISILSLYHAIKIIKNSYKCGICVDKNIVFIVALFLLLDAFDVIRFTLDF